jgi:hypothetical protein
MDGYHGSCGPAVPGPSLDSSGAACRLGSPHPVQYRNSTAKVRGRQSHRHSDFKAATHLFTQDADREHESTQADLKNSKHNSQRLVRELVRRLLHKLRLNSQTLRRP